MELLGREREVTELAERLAGHRLVTIVGPGGIGKTSLAREAARRHGPSFDQGARHVELASVEAPEAVGGALASQLGFPSLAALLASPSDDPVLVVVDNCEHVLDEAARAISALLEACGAPTVLATSRAPLDLPGESVLVLGPLALPEPGVDAGSGPALRLFCDRARDAGRSITDDELHTVGALCRALDGVPLALEIAAARTRVMTPAEMLANIGDLDMLARPRFRGAARHRSLRSTIEWSYAQLPADERRTFDRLGVLAGRFDLATAHAVSAEADEALATTAGRVEGLVTASLLVSEAHAGATRYRQLNALRTFALERLAERGEVADTWDRYVDHAVTAAIGVATAGRRSWEADVLGDMLALYDDAMAALRWAVEHDEGPGRSLLLLAVLWGVVHQGHADEVVAVGERVLSRWEDRDAPGWADAVATVATCRFALGTPREALVLAEPALEVADRSVLAACTLSRVVGQSRAALGDLAGAADAFDAAVHAARERGLGPYAQELAVYRAGIQADLGDVGGALAALGSVEAEARRVGSDVNHLWARTVTAFVLLRRDPAAAAEVAEGALRAARRAGHLDGTTACLQALAVGHLLAGRIPQASAHLHEVLDEVVAHGVLAELRGVLRIAAALLERAGAPAWEDLAATAATLSAVTSFTRAIEDVLPLPAHDGRVLSTREAVGVARTALDRSPADDRERPAGPGVAAADALTGLLVRDGDVWQVGYGERIVTMRPTKGLADLARLVARPDRELHCLDLAGAAAEEATTGEVVDETARRRYEERLRELQDELDDADRTNDRGRADRAQVEFDSIVEHLSAALGLGGRSRSGGGTAERARSAVTRRLRETIRRIAEVHPDLGRHLERSITTGAYCCYRPERPVRWRT